MAVAAVATGDLVRSLSRARSLSLREESLSSRGVSLVARELLVARSLSLRGVSLVARSLSLRGVSRCEESLIERGEEEDG